LAEIAVSALRLYTSTFKVDTLDAFKPKYTPPFLGCYSAPRVSLISTVGVPLGRGGSGSGDIGIPLDARWKEGTGGSNKTTSGLECGVLVLVSRDLGDRVEKRTSTGRGVATTEEAAMRRIRAAGNFMVDGMWGFGGCWYGDVLEVKS